MMPQLAVMKLAARGLRPFALRVPMKLVTALMMVTIRVRAVRVLQEQVTAEMAMA